MVLTTVMTMLTALTEMVVLTVFVESAILVMV